VRPLDIDSAVLQARDEVLEPLEHCRIIFGREQEPEAREDS
jgi:hypothetical protein